MPDRCGLCIERTASAGDSSAREGLSVTFQYHAWGLYTAWLWDRSQEPPRTPTVLGYVYRHGTRWGAQRADGHTLSTTYPTRADAAVALYRLEDHDAG